MKLKLISSTFLTLLVVGCSQLSLLDQFKVSAHKKVIELSRLVTMYSSSTGSQAIASDGLLKVNSIVSSFGLSDFTTVQKARSGRLSNSSCLEVDQNGTDYDRDNIPSIYVYRYINCSYTVPEGTVISNGKIIIKDFDDNNDSSGFSFEALGMKRQLYRNDGSTKLYAFSQHYDTQSNTDTSNTGFHFSYWDSDDTKTTSNKSEISGNLTPVNPARPFSELTVRASGSFNTSLGLILVNTNDLKINSRCANSIESGSLEFRQASSETTNLKLEYADCEVK